MPASCIQNKKILDTSSVEIPLIDTNDPSAPPYAVKVEYHEYPAQLPGKVSLGRRVVALTELASGLLVAGMQFHPPDPNKGKDATDEQFAVVVDFDAKAKEDSDFRTWIKQMKVKITHKQHDEKVVYTNKICSCDQVTLIGLRDGRGNSSENACRLQ